MPRIRVVLILGLLMSATVAGRAEDWPQFRGPSGQGQAVGADWPLRWSEDENIAWKVSILGRGWSSPVVSGQQIWLTTALDTAATAEVTKRTLERKGAGVPGPCVASHLTLKAICVECASGRVLYDTTLFEIDQPEVISSSNSFASPTPVVNRGRVFCDFGAMGTACVDAVTGAVVWSRRLVVDHQVGPGSSPVPYDNLLVLVRDGIDQQYIAALDQATGETVWRTDRPPLAPASPTVRKAFSTPLVFQHAGRDQMVVTGARWIVSYEPAIGKELWRVDTGNSFSNITRPVYGCGLVFAATSFGGSVLRAIRPDGQGDVTATHVAWQQTRMVPKHSSPLLVGDELYLVADNGVVSCLDARSGAINWSQRLPGTVLASPVAANGRIYFFGETGATTVVRPGKEFGRLAENHLDGRVLASPALVDQAVILRTATHLYKIQSTTK
jgi:outer membrane protein assembly factor BamB